MVTRATSRYSLWRDARRQEKEWRTMENEQEQREKRERGQTGWTPGEGSAHAELGQPYVNEQQTLLGHTPRRAIWKLQWNGFLHYWRRSPGGLNVIESLERHGGPRGDVWLHVSASHAQHVPSWEELRAVKDEFVGEGREAYVVFPPADRYVNDHPYVLHLWCAVDGPMLPDFRRMGPDGRLTL